MSTETAKTVDTGRPAEIAKPAGKLRYWISVGTFLIYIIAFFDRSNVAMLIADINFTDAMGITKDKASQGLLLTSFLLTYGVFCFFSGPIVSKFGARKTILWGLIAWSVIMAVMGSVSSLVILLVCRALLGIGESIVGPCMSKYVQDWYPVQERAKANGVWFSGIQLAQVIAMPIMVGLITYTGWRGSLISLGIIGIIPIIIVWLFMYNKPSDHPRITKEEVDYIAAGQPQSAAGQGTGTFGFVKSVPFWCVVTLYFLSCAYFWGVIGWLPVYFKSALGLSFARSGFAAAVPYLVSVLALMLVTPYMDKVKSKNLFASGAAILCGVVLVATAYVKTLELALIATSLLMTLISIIPTASFTMLQNNIKHSELANSVGILNGFGYGLSSFAPYAMGKVIDTTGSTGSGFMLLGSLAVIALLVALPLYKAKW